MKTYNYSTNGNRFVVVDNLKNQFRNEEIQSLAKRLMRFDGVLVISKSSKAFCYMKIFNADGSEADLCGNGLICSAQYIKDYHEKDALELSIETNAGVFNIEFDIDGSISVSKLTATPLMLHGKKLFGGYEYVQVNTGNSHAVIFVDDVNSADLEMIGPLINSQFKDSVNVEIAHVAGNVINMRVWERGVGITESCGTGACAVVAASILDGHIEYNIRSRLYRVVQPGGESFVLVDRVENGVYNLTLSAYSNEFKEN